MLLVVEFILVHVAMRDFLSGGISYAENLHAEVQCLTCQRMIHVEEYAICTYLRDKSLNLLIALFVVQVNGHPWFKLHVSRDGVMRHQFDCIRIVSVSYTHLTLPTSDLV